VSTERYVSTRDALRMSEGSEVRLRGWVYRWRDLGKRVFIVLRDSEGIIQVVAKRGFTPENYISVAREADVESSIVVEGVIHRDPRAPGGAEVWARRLEIVGLSRDFPIKGGESIEYLLDKRHLWIRSRRLTTLMKLRHKLFQSYREYFNSKGYYEVSPPMLTQAAVEGGATLFKVDFFGKPAYLTQSAQFYLEALIFSLEKVWTLAPSFRAERSRTRRHLYEYWHLEVEAAWSRMRDMMGLAEELIAHTVSSLLDNALEELSLIGRGTEELEPARKPGYPIIEYEEAIRILQRKGVNISYGDDLGADEERILTQEYETPFFIIYYPAELKSFYMKPRPERPDQVLAFDMLAPNVGEIIGGSEREDNYEALKKRIIERGYNVEEYEWYLDLRKYGSVPHSGFGLGVERQLMWLAGLDHIRDAIPFPRFRDRIYP